VKIAALAEAHEVNVAPHNFYGHQCTMTSDRARSPWLGLRAQRGRARGASAEAVRLDVVAGFQDLEPARPRASALGKAGADAAGWRAFS
jgi:hypothetical protein